MPQGLKALKQVAKPVGADLRDASLNLNGCCDAARHRHGMCHAGLIPNITESPHKRQTTKRGRKRHFDSAIQALRMQVERTLAWEDTCQRLWLRFERLQQRHSGMKFAGVDDDQPASVLRCLKLATSSWHRHVVTPQRTTARRAVLATRNPCRTAAVHTPG